MGCGSSKTTAVQPVRSGELEGDEETASKHGGRGDSAVSKGTTDSGVVMENKEISMLPGAVPMKLPPLTASPGLLRRDSPVAERPKSSEILEQLLNQGIIPVGQPRESGSKAGEAYNIMLDDGEVPKRRPPARLESLKARKEQVPNSREAIDQKMRLAEERRKLREEDLKMRLRTKSAHVRGPAPSSTFTPVEELQKPLTPEPPCTSESHEDSQDPPLHTKGSSVQRNPKPHLSVCMPLAALLAL
ncbi:stathmin domain-containing protein 1 [Myripristis murdjan]|uniref:stathmin domain-containing protein 1 n=1 Tax=Myripristis murdjan TaxID=586833 RepID=UPI0011760074|nr:stathmin domain-containing protein 1 [Myripristis murdjan]